MWLTAQEAKFARRVMPVKGNKQGLVGLQLPSTPPNANIACAA